MRAWRRLSYACRQCEEVLGDGVRPVRKEREAVRQVTDLIQTSVDARGSISGLVLFPKPEFLIGPPALGHIHSVALLKLVDATVWMLVLPGQPWTTERVHAAAGTLAGVSKQAFTTSSVERLLRGELGIRSLSVAVPTFDRVDELLWEIEKVAFALVRQPGAKQSYSEIDETWPEESEWTVGGALRDGLGKALRSFMGAMDSRALRIATAGRRFDLRVYNYLAHSDYRQYRLQFAETFPSLLRTAVVAAPRSFGEDLRSIVDAGAPLIKGLAARWGVRPGVIRNLVGRASNNVGFQWSRDAQGLALTLNALHPQDVPGDNPAEWDEFNRIAVTGQRLFLQPIWESAAGLEWLRICIRLSRRGDKQALALWLPEWNDIEQIIRFRTALTKGLRREIPQTRAKPANVADTTIVDAIDHAVLNIADQGLRNVASLFAEELARVRKKDRLWQIRSGEILMPLTPGDFVSADGATRVTALCTNHQLNLHGTRIRNCLRGSSVRSLSRKARIGTVFIVGIYDVQTGKARSTAEIRAVTGRDATCYHLVTRQHTAVANRKPSKQCRRTLREFLRYCQTDEVREHLVTNWRALRGRPSAAEDERPVSLPVALRGALGDQVYAGLVTSIRDTNHARHGGVRSE